MTDEERKGFEKWRDQDAKFIYTDPGAEQWAEEAWSASRRETAREVAEMIESKWGKGSADHIRRKYLGGDGEPSRP